MPLPDQTYLHLRAEAERAQVRATTLAREAIDTWLREQQRKTRQVQIAAFAEEVPGSTLDLDPDLEEAGIQHLLGNGVAETA